MVCGSFAAVHDTNYAATDLLVHVLDPELCRPPRAAYGDSIVCSIHHCHRLLRIRLSNINTPYPGKLCLVVANVPRLELLAAR